MPKTGDTFVCGQLFPDRGHLLCAEADLAVECSKERLDCLRREGSRLAILPTEIPPNGARYITRNISNVFPGNNLKDLPVLLVI